MLLSSISAPPSRYKKWNRLSNRTAPSSATKAGIMNEPSPNRKTVFATPWFQVLAAPAPGGGQPHYVIQAPDFVIIVAATRQDRLLLVRQFRTAVEAIKSEEI